MQVFAILGVAPLPPDVDPGQSVVSKIVSQFPDDHLPINDYTYFVACKGLTTQDLANKIGIEDGPGVGIVVNVGSYWGRYNASVWEWLASP